MTEAMPFLQKTILLSYDPRSLQGGIFLFSAMHLNMPICIFSLCAGFGQYRSTAFHKAPVEHMCESRALLFLYRRSVLHLLPI